MLFILFDGLTPTSLAQRQEEIEQENNLVYVAYTRAKHTLIFLNDFTREEHLKEEVQTHSKRLDTYVAKLTKEPEVPKGWVFSCL